MQIINNIYIDVTSGRVNVSRQGLAGMTGAGECRARRLLRSLEAGVSLCCDDPNKLLSFQGNGFLICETVRESQEKGSSHSLKKAPCKEKLLEHMLKEPLGDALGMGTWPA